MITTCQRPLLGLRAEVCTSARISATEMDRPSGSTTRTSACVPASVVWQPLHSPQPGGVSVHSTAAANARAATVRPEPGGPVNSHACVIPEPDPPATSAAAVCAAAFSSVIASVCPTTLSHTLTLAPLPDVP